MMLQSYGGRIGMMIRIVPLVYYLVPIWIVTSPLNGIHVLHLNGAVRVHVKVHSIVVRRRQVRLKQGQLLTMPRHSFQYQIERATIAFPTTNQGVFIDMHSFGRGVGWPWGFKNQKARNDQQLGALGRKMASYGAWSLWAPTMPKHTYGFDGGTIDCMHGYLGVASYFYELGTKFYQDCADYSDVIDETFPEGCTLSIHSWHTMYDHIFDHNRKQQAIHYYQSGSEDEKFI